MGSSAQAWADGLPPTAIGSTMVACFWKIITLGGVPASSGNYAENKTEYRTKLRLPAKYLKCKF
jgi:hypothetical protein